MSRLYSFDVDVDAPMTGEMEKELGDEIFGGGFYEASSSNGETRYTGEVTLYCGMDDEERAHEISKMVWEKLGSRVPVTVRAMCMEDLPFNEYEFGDDDGTVGAGEGDDEID